VDTLVWDAQLWYGGDYDRLWIETEGEHIVSGGDGSEIENLDIQYSRRIGRYWDLQGGVGYQRIYGSGPDGPAQPRPIQRLVQDRIDTFVEQQVDTVVEQLSPRLARLRDLRGRYQDFQALYQRVFPPPGPNRDRAYAVVGPQGLAPYWFKADTNLRLSADGDLWVDAEGEDPESFSVVAGVRMWFWKLETSRAGLSNGRAPLSSLFW
jgi:uncharacterized protein involved in copper resistance